MTARNMHVFFYAVGALTLLLGLASGQISNGGCEEPIYGTCLVLTGYAATLAKIGSVTVIVGWFIELLALCRKETE